MRPAGKGRGGEGSCESGTWVAVGTRVGRAIDPAMRRAESGARIESFMVALCEVEGPEAGYW